MDVIAKSGLEQMILRENGRVVHFGESCKVSSATQLAFNNSIVFSPSVKLSRPPEEYCGDAEKASLNARFFNVLTKCSKADFDKLARAYSCLDYSFLDFFEHLLLEKLEAKYKSVDLLIDKDYKFVAGLLGVETFPFKYINACYASIPANNLDLVERVLLDNDLHFSLAKEFCVPPIRAGFSYDNLGQIGVQKAHRITKGEGARVCVIDTGIDFNHAEFSSCYAGGISFVGSGKPVDLNGHGTHVCGIVAGSSCGVAPGCELYVARVLGANGSGSEIAVIHALEWAAENKFGVVNLSLGSLLPSRFEERAIKYLISSGAVVVAAAGNDGNSSYNYPASYPGVVSVAAVDSENSRAYFSNYNDRVFISAPGVGIRSCYLDDSYKDLSGTSMASPHVAGVCALARTHSSSEMKKLLRNTALALGNSREYGAGLVRADGVAQHVFRSKREVVYV